MIVLDATPLASRHGVRGIGRYVAGVVSALSADDEVGRGKRVCVLVARDQRAPSGPWSTATTVRGRVRPQDLGWLVAAVADRRVAHRLRPFWWHQTDPMLPWGPLRSTRTIVTAYDLIPLREPAVWQQIRPHRRLLYRAYLRSLQRAARVASISEATASELERMLGIPRRRIHVVPPAIGAPEAGPCATLDPDAPRLLFVGVTDPHKRPELALMTLAALRRTRPSARLDFVGPSPAPSLQALARLAGQLQLTSFVSFLGRVSDDHLTQLYRRSVLLAVSRVEGFGLPPVEAILAGGRVVATPTPIYREVLDATATFAGNDQPESIATAVEEAIRSTPDASVRRSLAERYSPGRTREALLDLYGDLGP